MYGADLDAWGPVLVTLSDDELMQREKADVRMLVHGGCVVSSLYRSERHVDGGEPAVWLFRSFSSWPLPVLLRLSRNAELWMRLDHDNGAPTSARSAPTTPSAWSSASVLVHVSLSPCGTWSPPSTAPVERNKSPADDGPKIRFTLEITAYLKNWLREKLAGNYRGEL